MTKWQSGSDLINNGNCMAFNFGHIGELPVPSLNIKLIASPNMKNYDFKTYYKCYLVFIEGRYVQELETVIDMIEDITNVFNGTIPASVFLMGKYNNVLSNSTLLKIRSALVKKNSI